MLKTREYVVIVEDSEGMALFEFCFLKVEQANNLLQRLSLKQGQTAVLIERMA